MSNPNVLAAPSTGCQTQFDRRVAVRFSVSPDTECQATATSQGDLWPGWVRDLSTTGIGVILECAFPVGSWLTVELDNQRQGTSRQVRARVVHALELPNETWLHGCALERDLTEEELNAFIE